MRRQHFEILKPVCPYCKFEHQQEHPLHLNSVLREHSDTVFEGILNCSNSHCQLEYPVIDGIPVLMVNAREYLSSNFAHIVARDDLPESLESLLGDSAGPDRLYNRTRQHLSTYAWDGYADFDPAEPVVADSHPENVPGAVRRCLELGLQMLAGPVLGPVLDMGCAVGRSSFELAGNTDAPVLGFDVNFSMLRLALNVLHQGVVSYPKRRVGLVYQRRSFEAAFPSAGQVDFWACDAQMLPFSDSTFGLTVGLQLLDAVASPVALLESVCRVLREQGSAILATPYDWSSQVTSVEAWIGGHSQRGPNEGAAEPLLRSLLTPGAHPQSINGLELGREQQAVNWHNRIHDRSAMNYSTHLVTATRTGS